MRPCPPEILKRRRTIWGQTFRRTNQVFRTNYISGSARSVRLRASRPRCCGFGKLSFPVSAPNEPLPASASTRKKDVLLILKIKHLLYERKFTIQGARQHLKTTGRKSPRLSAGILVEIRSTLEDIRRLLDP